MNKINKTIIITFLNFGLIILAVLAFGTIPMSAYGCETNGCNYYYPPPRPTPPPRPNPPAPYPTVELTASPNSNSYNQSATLYWNSSNANYCNASGGSNGWAGNKSTSGTFYTGELNGNTTFYITCSNNTGSASDSVTVYVENNNHYENVSVNITADDTNIDFEDSTRIRWDSDNADYCTPSGGTNDWDNEDINTSGSFNTEELTGDETFRITCYNNSDSATDSVTVRVNEDNSNNEPDVTTRSATSIKTDGATLNGRVDGNGSSARAWFEYGTNNNLGYTTSTNSYGSGSKTYDRSISGLMPNTYYYFRAVAENSEGTVYGSILSFRTTGNSVPVNNQPTVIIYADQTNLAYNAGTTIRWSTNNATSCNASGGFGGWAGAKEIGTGSFYTGALTETRTYAITCSNNVGSSADSVTINVRGQVLGASITRPAPTPTSVVLITSSINRNQSIMPTLDNARPKPGDEINYTVSYQNIGTGAITSLVLQIALPQEVDYLFSTGSNPSIFGNTLVFNLGTLKANGEGSISVRVRVQNNVVNGTNLNFPAVLSYVDPSGQPQSVNANVTAQVWNQPINESIVIPLGANVFGAGFLPTNIFGWLLLLILLLILVLLVRYLFRDVQPFSKKTTTTTTTMV